MPLQYIYYLFVCLSLRQCALVMFDQWHLYSMEMWLLSRGLEVYRAITPPSDTRIHLCVSEGRLQQRLLQNFLQINLLLLLHRQIGITYVGRVKCIQHLKMNTSWYPALSASSKIDEFEVDLTFTQTKPFINGWQM
jgi:hypothetical protein